MSEEPQEPHISPETLDLGAVAKVATRVRLKDVRLLLSWVGRFAVLQDIDPEWGETAFMGFDSHSEDIEHDGDGATFVVHCSFVCRSDEEGAEKNDEDADTDSEEPPDVDIHAVFELVYELSNVEGIETSDLEHFAFANGTHNAWPYWREYAHATTLRMGVPPYLVPPFKLPSPHDPDASEQAGDSE